MESLLIVGLVSTLAGLAPMPNPDADAVSALGSASGEVISGDEIVYIFKEARTLRRDPARVAVFAPTRVTPSLTALPLAGWSFAAPDDVPEAQFTTPVFEGEAGEFVFPTPSLLIGFHAAPDDAALQDVARQANAAEVSRPWASFPHMAVLSLSARDGHTVLEMARRLAARPDVAFCEPDMVFSGRGGLIPNDPRFGECWGIHNTGQSGGLVDFDMDGPEAWDLTFGDASIISVVIDTGVDLAHPDLREGPGNDFTGQNGGGLPVNACDRHGTPVAGCISAIANNALGTAGIAPGTRAASARAFISNSPCNGSWSGTSANTVSALNWAQSIGARVTNNSNVYGFTSSAIATAYASTKAAGIIHFACAGNNGTATLAYPASLSSVNAVAATDRFGNRASFSQFGSGLDFSAPGASILSLDISGAGGYNATDYATVNGTSFASPYAAGVAALVRSRFPGLPVQRVEAALQRGCVDMDAPGYDTNTGWGHVNARRSILVMCVDFNEDDEIDFSDIEGFLTAYAAQIPGSCVPGADFNGDSEFDFSDIEVFVAAYTELGR